MKLHLPKALCATIIAAGMIGAVTQAASVIERYDADGNLIATDDTDTPVASTKEVYTYISLTNGTGSAEATFSDHTSNRFDIGTETAASEADKTALVISGNEGNIVASTTNGGAGGRVNLTNTNTSTYCTDVILNKGIEADISGVQATSGLTLTVDNASIYGNNSTNWNFNLHIGDGGVRLNGTHNVNYTVAGNVTGSGNFVIHSGPQEAGAQYIAFTGDLSEFTGTWTDNGASNAGNRAFQFGDGSTACPNGKVGGNVGTETKAAIAEYNYTGNYAVKGDVYTKSLTVKGGNATFEKTVNLAEAGTITLENGTTSFNALKAHSNGNSITVNKQAILNAVTLSEGSGAIILKGSGTYNLGASVTSNVQGLKANTWTGTVVVDGATDNLAGMTDNVKTGIATLGHGGSKVELKNCSGYITTGIDSAIILTDSTDGVAALTIKDGSSNATNSNHNMATFNGAISGSGTMKIAWNPQNNHDAYTGFTFNGDISGWKGAFEQTLYKKFTIFLTGAADTVNASIKNTGTVGELYLDVNTTNSASFSKEVTVDKVMLKKNATFTNTLTTKELKIGADSTPKATVSGADGSTAAVLKSTGTGGMVGVDAETGAAYIANMELTNAKITADVAATHVYLQNITGSAMLGTGTYDFLGVKAEAAAATEGGNTINYTIATPTLTLSTTDVTLLISASPMADAQSYSEALTLNFTGLNVLNATEQDWSAFISFGGELGEILEKQGWAYAQPELSALAEVDTEKALVSLGFTGEALTSITISNLSIPEPTTATLSFLALAGLAARRRRK